jgi:hypothetical protein
MFMGSGTAYAGMLRDLYKSNIEGDERYDRDWNLSDAMTPAYDAMSLFGFRPAAAALKSKLATGAAKGAGKGLQKGYNAATGAKRGASTAPKITGPKGSMPKSSGKKTLDAPDGKPGMMQKGVDLVKRNPKTAAIGGVAAGIGAGVGLKQALEEEQPEGLEPLPVEAVEEDAVNPNLDNPDGQMPMTPEGQAQAAMQAKANSMPDMVDRLGGSGSKMGNLAKGRVQAQANFMADDIIKAQKIQARKDASKAHREGVMADNWETSQIGRADGRAWNELDDDTRQEMQKRFMANMGSPYDSSKNARQDKLDKIINEFGGNYVDPQGRTDAPGQLTKEQFSEQTGLKNAGTGIVNTTLDGKGPVTTLEMGGQFDKAGGLETAKPFLSDAQQVNLERQLDRPGVFNDQFGQEQEMSKDTVRLTSDEQDYSNANFQNRDDALAYLNRGASLDEPAPETPDAPAPEGEGEAEQSEDDGWGWSDAAKGAGLIGGGLLLSRTKPGRKMIQKGFDMFGKKSYPPGRNKILQDAVNRNAASGSSKVSGGLGRPGSMQQMGYQGGTPQSVGRVIKVNPWSTARNAKPATQPQANPWASTGNMKPPAPTPQSVGRAAPPPPQANPWASTGNMKPNYSGGTPQSVGGPTPTQNLSNPWASTGNMKPRAATPQDAGFNSRVDAMGRQDLIRGVGSPRTADGRRVATDEELRRLYRAMNQQIF